jgi:hypothetical protein
MLATARDYKRRAKELERAGTRLQRDRDKAIRKAVKGGMPVADVGDAFGLSQQRGRCRPRDALRRGNPRDGPRRLESGAPLVAHELSVGVDAGDYPEEDSHLDGTGVQQNFIIDAFKVLVGVAVDDDHLYWARQDAHAIARSNLAGTGVEENFIDIDAGDENVHYPQGVAVDAGHVYWAADGNGSRVGRANLDGTGVQPQFVSETEAGGDLRGVAVDAGHVYWNGVGPIGRANLDGTGVELPWFLAPGLRKAGVAVDAGHIYWITEFTIGRANLDGTGVDNFFIPTLTSVFSVSPRGIAVDGGHIYWTNPISIGRANLDGTGVDQHFIDVTCQASTGCPATAGEPRGVAVDGG